MNGKLVVLIPEEIDAKAFAYLQPNYFSDEFGTYGIMENGMVYSLNTLSEGEQTFEVPTDWTIHIVYNIGMLSGKLKVKSYVTDYEISDKENINGKW